MTEYKYNDQWTRVYQLLDHVPEEKLLYVIGFLEGVSVPEEKPNAATLEAMAEADQMIATGAGEHFTGSTEELFSKLLEE